MMKKLLEDFKTLDNSWKFIIVGSLIGLVGYVMSETVTYEFWYPLHWVGIGIAIFGWLMAAFGK